MNDDCFFPGDCPTSAQIRKRLAAQRIIAELLAKTLEDRDLEIDAEEREEIKNELRRFGY